MPGAGKSTLLRAALKARTPLFGPEDDLAFQRTALPNVDEEEDLSRDQRIEQGTWLDNEPLINPQLIPPNLQTMVAHVAIFQLVMLASYLKPPKPEMARYTRDLVHHLTDAKVVEVALRVLLSRVKAQTWDRVCVNTLEPPYRQARDQWQRRRQQRSSSAQNTFNAEGIRDHSMDQLLVQRVYGDDAGGPLIYQTMYTAWHRAIQALQPSVIMRSFGDSPDR